MALILLLAVLLFGAAHVMLPPIERGQEPPERHYPGDCVICHVVVRDLPEVTP